MKSFAIFALLVFGFPAISSADDKHFAPLKVGDWEVSGSDGDCLAALRHGEIMLGVLSPASDAANNGGISIVGPSKWITQGQSAEIEFRDFRRWRYNVAAEGDESIPGYWIPFESLDRVGSFPDTFQVSVIIQDAVVTKFEVKGFKQAIHALQVCEEKVR